MDHAKVRRLPGTMQKRGLEELPLTQGQGRRREELPGAVVGAGGPRGAIPH